MYEKECFTHEQYLSVCVISHRGTSNWTPKHNRPFKTGKVLRVTYRLRTETCSSYLECALLSSACNDIIADSQGRRSPLSQLTTEGSSSLLWGEIAKPGIQQGIKTM